MNGVDVILAADAAGAPGAPIETFHVESVHGGAGLDNPPVVVHSTLRPTLVSGSVYWLIVSPQAPATPLLWLTAFVLPNPPLWGFNDGTNGWAIQAADHTTHTGAYSLYSAKPPLPIGAFNPSQAVWIMDANRNYTWDGIPSDIFRSWGSPSNVPVTGDWNGSGTTKMGVFNSSTGVWLLDFNGNGIWDGSGVDKLVAWGSPGDTPVVGNWNGNGQATKIGTFNSSQGIWLLDFDGDFLWGGLLNDKVVAWGSPGDKPVVGNWSGYMTADKIGVFNPSQGWWLLDHNGNFAYEPGVDKFLRWGSPGDTPVVGDWNGSGPVKIGVFNSAQAVWLLDYNGNYQWDGAGVDKFLQWGSPGDIPVTGDWDGYGRTKIAVFNPNQGWWVIDYNGNYVWEGAATDRFLRWGSPGDVPIVGTW